MDFKKKRADDSRYLIFGNGYEILIPKSVYSVEYIESDGLQRARAYSACLYRRKDGIITRVVNPGQYTAPDPKLLKPQMSRDMLGNEAFVPGINVSY